MTSTIVITCAVPCSELDQLKLTKADHVVSVTGPAGFRHELELPAEADMDQLDVELFKGYLELRAPRRST